MGNFKILVGVKRVIDYAVKIRVKGSGESGRIDYANVKHSMNPFDEIAVEEALRIKRKLGGRAEIVVASIGPKGAGETLRTALAMGADRAIHVDLDTSEISNSAEIQNQLQPQAVAKIFEKLYEKESPQLVLLGKQAIDDDSNATGQLLAGFLDIPQATFASKVDVFESEGKIHVTREIDGGLEVLECQLPSVITADLRLNEPRYATLPNIMKAKSKPFHVETLQSLGVAEAVRGISERLKIKEIREPEKRKGGVRVATVDELIDKLRNEAGVL